MTTIQIQKANRKLVTPSTAQLRHWALAALPEGRKNAELCIRLVDIDEAAYLNHQYRGKEYATNVLSFPADLPKGVDIPLLGDIVICAPVVQREAAEQGKSETAHWAHLVIHGVLHLLGFDHEDDNEAEVMENHEIELLQQLGFNDPYQPIAP